MRLTKVAKIAPPLLQFVALKQRTMEEHCNPDASESAETQFPVFPTKAEPEKGFHASTSAADARWRADSHGQVCHADTTAELLPLRRHFSKISFDRFTVVGW